MSIKRSISKIKLQNLTLLVLIAFAILSLIYFLSNNPQIMGSNNSFLQGFLGEGKNEASLKNKYLEFSRVYESKNYKNVYKMLASSVREKYSEEKIIDTFTKSESKRTKMERNINKIVIQDNTGFIDQTVISCYDQDCIDKKTSRRYQKWIFLDRHWYLTLESPKCIRDKPYPKSPEFDRAISLIRQRMKEANIAFLSSTGDAYDEIYNCINIQYADLKERGEGPEGVFYFDENVSSPEHLLINVDYSYHLKDDLLTALLLVHEATHAVQYLNKYFYDEEVSCFDSEISAFASELILIRTFNPEELNSLNTRVIDSQLSSYNPNFDFLVQLAKINRLANDECTVSQFDVSGDCYWDSVRFNLDQIVRNNPYYQKQCSNSN